MQCDKTYDDYRRMMLLERIYLSHSNKGNRSTNDTDYEAMKGQVSRAVLKSTITERQH